MPVSPLWIFIPWKQEPWLFFVSMDNSKLILSEKIFVKRTNQLSFPWNRGVKKVQKNKIQREAILVKDKIKHNKNMKFLLKIQILCFHIKRLWLKLSVSPIAVSSLERKSSPRKFLSSNIFFKFWQNNISSFQLYIQKNFQSKMREIWCRTVLVFLCMTYLYRPHFLYPIIHWWILRLFPSLSYYK